MKRIALTQGKFALVDDEDYEWLNKWVWQAWTTKRDKKVYYAIRQNYINGIEGTLFMHRAILGLKLNDGKEVDHKDHNGLNNQRHNLRVASKSANMSNYSGIRTNNTSGFTGVSWCKYKNKWRTQISLKGKITTLRYSHSKIKAAHIYDRAVIEFRDEFATTNFPRENYK